MMMMMMMIMTSNNNTEGARSCRMEGSELLLGPQLMCNDILEKYSSFVSVTTWRPNENFL